jgi:hypothetical protein
VEIKMKKQAKEMARNPESMPLLLLSFGIGEAAFGPDSRGPAPNTNCN